MFKIPLRVGFFCASPFLKKWQAECLEAVAATKGIEVIIAYCAPQANSSPAGLVQVSIQKRLRNFIGSKTRLWNLYYYFFIHGKVSRLKTVDLTKRFKDFKSVRVTYTKSRGRLTFTPDSLADIRTQKFSALINFDLAILTGEILKVPDYGVWSFHHGDEELYRGLPPGFWEIYNNEKLNGLILQRLNEKLDAGQVLAKGFVPANSRSLRYTLEVLFSAGVEWPAKLCRLILDSPSNVEFIPSIVGPKIYKAPRGPFLIKFLTKIFARNFKYLIHRFFLAERWRIGILECSVEDIVSKPLESLHPVWLPEISKRYFEADPFGYTHNGQPYILFEFFDYKAGLGRICSIKYEPANKTFHDQKMQIMQPYHLSYPFIFNYENQTYSLVENYTEGKRNYFVLDAAGNWQDHLSIPSEKKINDPTLIEHEGLWYLFYTEGLYGSNFNLNISYSTSPFGPFTDHLRNPVKIDVRSSRSAGPFYKRNGQLFRPCQNSIDGYGSYLRIYQITTLSPKEYHENFIKELQAPKAWGNFSGLHTLSKLNEDLTLVDCKTYEFVWIHFFELIKEKFRFIK